MQDLRNLVLESGLYDEAFYLKNNPDVAMLAIDPLEHFLSVGGRLGRDPGPHFSSKKFLDMNPATRDRRSNPLVDYLKGRKAVENTPDRQRGSLAAIFISGESIKKPGFIYRIERYRKAFSDIGYNTKTYHLSDERDFRDEIQFAEFLYIWRAAWGRECADIVARAKTFDVPVIYDIDDLMIRPDLATPEYIDAIRFDKKDAKRVVDHYRRVTRAMTNASYCTASTEELTWQMRRHGDRRPTFVIPNGFDDDTYHVSRAARRQYLETRTDGLIRIGYAGGSRTHQRDFKECSEALAHILKIHPNTRLVLFREGSKDKLDVKEFPELADLSAQIEWRNFVSHSELPYEIARFDINLAPLQFGNPFCEAKSELKYFEAAICGVPTVASPTGPFKRAIEDGHTGFLAYTTEQWSTQLESLVESKARRDLIGQNAHNSALWAFGPSRRARLARQLSKMIQGRPEASDTFLVHHADKVHGYKKIEYPEYKVEFSRSSSVQALVSIIIPLYNYESYVEETLDSIKNQNLSDIELIVVDDKSTDGSLERVRRWMSRHANRFTRTLLVSHLVNQGLGASRNTAFNLADSLYVMAVDADNKIRPDCCKNCYNAIIQSRGAFAYPTIQRFGDSTSLMGNRPFNPADFVQGNGIDAMAMISKEAWGLVGGYVTHRMGWQDYDFWCRLVSHGLHGVHVPEILADYRVHQSSMLRTSTDKSKNKLALVAQIENDHPWTSIIAERDGHKVPAGSLHRN